MNFVNKDLSLIVLSDSSSTVKRFRLSRRLLKGAAAFLALCLLALGIGIYQYISLQSDLAANRRNKRRIAQQAREVTLQRQEIQSFARQINDLKKKLIALHQFEEKIRIIADIDKKSHSSGLFGIGGPSPEDLNPDMDLTRQHHRLLKNMHAQIKQMDVATIRQQSDFKYLLKKLKEQKNILSHTPSIRPARGWVTSRFAYRVSPFTGKREFHKGLDIANRRGTPIVATADGVIKFAGRDGSFGRLVVIQHGYGITTKYGHLEKTLVKRGQHVLRGQKIGLMGSTGRSTGPHVHYEVHVHGVAVNPQKYIMN